MRFGETPTERKEHLIAQRERWADLQNAYLERYQHADRVDARSLKAQGIGREPERHLGRDRFSASILTSYRPFLSAGKRKDRFSSAVMNVTA